MKRILISILLVLLSVPGIFAQKVIGSYTLSHFNKSYPIEIGPIRNGKFRIYIGIEAKNSTIAFFSFENSSLRELLDALEEMKNKFQKWSKVATDNNVTEITKSMDIKFPYAKAEWKSYRWFSSFSHDKWKPEFHILQDGTYVVRINTTVRDPYTYKDKDIHETINWIFSSAEELDELIAQLDEKMFAKLVEEENAKSALFK